VRIHLEEIAAVDKLLASVAGHLRIAPNMLGTRNAVFLCSGSGIRGSRIRIRVS
jgi:hypothetical protein